jgi:hypothetical protein
MTKHKLRESADFIHESVNWRHSQESIYTAYTVYFLTIIVPTLVVEYLRYIQSTSTIIVGTDTSRGKFYTFWDSEIYVYEVEVYF